MAQVSCGLLQINTFSERTHCFTAKVSVGTQDGGSIVCVGKCERTGITARDIIARRVVSMGEVTHAGHYVAGQDGKDWSLLCASNSPASRTIHDSASECLDCL